jgi:hypothetical protein
MKTKKDIGTVLQEKLDGMRKSPPQDVWEHVEYQLNVASKRRRRLLWSFTGAAIVLLFLTFFIMDTPMESSEQNSDLPPQRETSPQTEKVAPITKQNTHDAPRKTKQHTVGEEDENRKNVDPIDKEPNSEDQTRMTSRQILKNEGGSKKDIIVTNIPTPKTGEIPSTVDSVQNPADSSNVKTFYHYFKGSDSTTHTTQNRKWIDSVIYQPRQSDSLKNE